MGCASNSGVTTDINTEKYPIVSESQGFQSPIEAIGKFSKLKDLKDNELRALKDSALTELLNQQKNVATELKKTNRLSLKPGMSYDFMLESFCVNAGVTRPVVGDGLFLGDLEGNPKSWFPVIATSYKVKGVTQEDAQVLIWSLLSGSRFDELGYENQQNLLKFFPDAPIRFGNSIVENTAQDFLLSQIPSEILAAKNSYDQFKGLLQDTSSKFSDIEKVLSPEPSRTQAIPVGWVRHSQGFFIRLKSHGYHQVQVQIYVPEDLKQSSYFEPALHVALPGEGQRLALSTNVIDETGNELSKYLKKKSGLSVREAAFILKHPLDSLKIYEASKKALDLTWKHQSSNNDFSNDRSDAFRHFIWSGMTAREVGVAKANEFLTAHEEYPGNPAKEKAMDLHNNSQGLEFYKGYKGENFEEDIVKEGLQKIKTGELKWLL